MRRDVQEIFRSTPHQKQVLMFSATLSKEIRPVCKKFMQSVRLSNILIILHNIDNLNTSFLSPCKPSLYKCTLLPLIELCS